MLVLTRKCSETIRIGDEIVVKIVRTGTTAVRIGIEAPDHVRVLRGELLDDIDRHPPRVDLVDFDESNLPQYALSCSDQYPHAA